MLNIRYDYGFVGKLFGVSRKLLSQLGGFCTSFTIEGKILKATFPAFPVPDKNPVKFWIDEDELASFIQEQGITPEQITHNDIIDWDTATSDFLTDDDYTTLSEAIEDLTAIVEDVLSEMEFFLSADDIGVTVAAHNHTHTSANITDWDSATSSFVTDADLSGYALDSDLVACENAISDLSDIVDSILADYVTIDDLDDFITTDEIPNDFLTAIASRKSGSFTFVTDIQFNGTALQKKTQAVTVTQGVVTNISTASGWSTWHTPTVITWA